MKMDPLPERLDRPDHPGRGLRSAARRPVNGRHGEGRRAAQLAQEPPLEPEVDPQPLRDREHKLLGRHPLAETRGRWALNHSASNP
jgi:hypothetical protein